MQQTKVKNHSIHHSLLALILVCVIAACSADPASRIRHKDSDSQEGEGAGQSDSDVKRSSVSTLQIAATGDFPFDRSDDRRRIGLTHDRLNRLVAIQGSVSDTSRSAILLKHLRATTSKFSQELAQNLRPESADTDRFLDSCSKTISTMGLLAAIDAKTNVPLDKREAERIAITYLQNVVSPYADAAQIPWTKAKAIADWNDKSLPRARRITAYNYIYRLGLEDAIYVGGGDRIFLDAGIESTCIGIGYDWLFQSLNTDAHRSKKLQVEVALEALLRWSIALDKPFFSSDEHPVQRDSNWNPVMTGGAGLVAIAALKDVQRQSCSVELSRTINGSLVKSWSLNQLARLQVCLSTRAIKHYWTAFTAGGAYKEGPSYWFFGMESYVLFRDALSEVLGRDELWDGYGALEEKSALAENLQILQEGKFWAVDPLESSDVVKLYNHGDASSTRQISAYPFLSTAARSGNAEIRHIGLRILEQQLSNEKSSGGKISMKWATSRFDFSRVFTLFLSPDGDIPSLVYHPISIVTDADHELDLVRMQTLRSKERWVVHQKGGRFFDGHSQLDSGSFTLNIQGRTWLGDLGLEHTKSGYPFDYFKVPRDGLLEYAGGLRYFRKNDLSHNLVSLPDRPLRLNGSAKLREHATTTVEGSTTPLYTVTWDNGTLYNPVASAGIRKMRLADRADRPTLDIVDQIDFANTPELSREVANWHVLHCPENATGSSIVTRRVGSLARDVEISLTPEDGVREEKLFLSLLSPANSEFEVIAADPNDPITGTSIGKSPLGPKPASNIAGLDPRCKLSDEQQNCLAGLPRASSPASAISQCGVSMKPESCNEGCKIIRVRAKGADLETLQGSSKRLKFVVRVRKQ